MIDCKQLTVHLTWFGHYIVLTNFIAFCSWYWVFSYLLFSVYHVVIVHIVYMHEHFPFLIHLLGRFDDPRFACPDIDMLYFNDQVFDKPMHVARSLELFPIRFWYSCLLFYPISVFFLILVHQIQSLMLFFIYMISW